jgi:hypothetical protein
MQKEIQDFAIEIGIVILGAISLAHWAHNVWAGIFFPCAWILANRCQRS